VDPNRIHLVRVTTPDQKNQLCAAATSREEAVDRVLSAAAEGSNARLMDGCLKPRQDAVRSMTAGEVRELSK
jgi:hypothetical protein